MPKTASYHKRGTSIVLNGSPSKSPLKIPLNDDAQEKAKRLQSRQALHDIQINQIKAAASPVRKLANLDQAGSSSPPSNPKTPRRIGRDNDLEAGLLVVGGTAVTPMKRVPLLANFEEWMKMATDNKINATNSWNFALIDYFHDLSLLKEGDGVNFQKASCTLDGCVKIYTSRVDSVATETGKLLSGLANSSNSKTNKSEKENGDDIGDDSEEEIEDEDGVVRKRCKKRTQRSSDTTIASSFATLRLKKFELEFSVDPLFKKASADFDEGGAKGLLLNHLSIDSQGRIVFDSSDDTADGSSEDRASTPKDGSPDENEQVESESPAEILTAIDQDGDESLENNISLLGARFFPNLDNLEDQDICPTLKTFDLGDTSSDTLNIPFLKPPEDWRQEKEKITGKDETYKSASLCVRNQPSESNDVDDDDDDDALVGNFELPVDIEFGEGGEAWAREAFVETRVRVHDIGYDYDGMGCSGDGEDGDVRVSPEFVSPIDTARKLKEDHDGILSFFDEALQKNWAGPEHWRIRKMKDKNKPISVSKVKKEKGLFEIDFASTANDNSAEIIYTQPSSKNTIALPRKERKPKNKNLLPDDKHFNSKQLLGLFLKPNARPAFYKNGVYHKTSIAKHAEDVDPSGYEISEAYWARETDNSEAVDTITQENYDANFFQDNETIPTEGLDYDDIEFTDAPNHASHGLLESEDRIADIGTNLQVDSSHDGKGGFGSQLVTQNRRLRPEYVQYARVAKKVDVRKLKEELWKGIGFNDLGIDTKTIDNENVKNVKGSLMFTSVMQSLQKVYPKQIMNDISTSYCFICLLHLANEKGLIIKNKEGLLDLEIMRDPTVEGIEAQ